MEIPNNLKNLYKHWNAHIIKPAQTQEVSLNQEILSQIFSVITERMKIWGERQKEQKPPYTLDPIFAKYRFCNIYRELDRQTIEIHTMLKSLEKAFDIWLLNMLFSRMVCNPQTIKCVGFLNYNNKNNKSVYEKLMQLPRPKYGVAYIFPISLVQKVGLKTREEFFCFYLPKVTKLCTAKINKFNKLGVSDALELVLPAFGLNFKFHWTETLIDVAYQFPKYIDLFKKFPIGPGALPTMKKLNSIENPEKINLALVSLEIPNFPYLTFNGKQVGLSAENWEGIGCEFRKYSNLNTGKGRKRKYKI